LPSTMHSPTIFCFVTLALLPTAESYAGGWVKEPGESYIRLAAGLFRSAGYWELDGAFVEDPALQYQNQSASLYVEVGILPRVALGFSLPYLVASNTDVFDIQYQRTSLGDLDSFIQVQIFKEGRFALSTQVLLRVPLYAGVLTGVNQQTGWVSESLPAFSQFFPAIGDGSIDVVPTLQFGIGLWPVPGWFTAEVGPRLRTRGFGASLSYAVSAGIFVWPEWLALTGRVCGWQRFSANHESPTSSLLSVAGGVLVPLVFGLALEAEAFYVPLGRFVARGGGVSVGLSYNGEIFQNPWE
jgi:hypothetical protein